MSHRAGIKLRRSFDTFNARFIDVVVAERTRVAANQVVDIVTIT